MNRWNLIITHREGWHVALTLTLNEELLIQNCHGNTIYERLGVRVVRGGRNTEEEGYDGPGRE